MTLLRAVGFPTRMHAFRLNREVQKGVIPPLQYRFAPSEILHTWAEVLYQNHWVVLEGVILDEDYINGFVNQYCKANFIKQKEIQSLPYKYGFKGYGFGVDNLFDLRLRWTGEDTYVQSTGIIRDLGVFSSADECFQKYEQKLNPIKKIIYSHVTREEMNRRVERFRIFLKVIEKKNYTTHTGVSPSLKMFLPSNLKRSSYFFQKEKYARTKERSDKGPFSDISNAVSFNI